MFLHNSQELERHTAGFLSSGLPFLYRGFTRIEIAGKDRLADMVAFTKLFNLMRFDESGNS